MRELVRAAEESPVTPGAGPGSHRGLRAWCDRAFHVAASDNLANMERLLTGERATRLLDLGCDDGSHTIRFATALGAVDVHGVEVVEARALVAAERGVLVAVSDVDSPLPYDDASFDVVCSNQVIEHVHDTDNFVAETRRVLRPGGYTVVSTENLASWHNLAPLLFGWQPFSLTNVSGVRLGLGNPAALHRAENGQRPAAWEHRRVFAHRGLMELLEAHGLEVEKVAGAGYYPLPSRVARRDRRHAAFLTLKARRPG